MPPHQLSVFSMPTSSSKITQVAQFDSINYSRECERKRRSGDLAINAARQPRAVSAGFIVANMPNAREECATSCNFNYQRDIRHVFKPNNWILSSIGIWPLAIRNIGQHISNVAITFYNFIMGFTMVPYFLYILYDTLEEDIIIKLKLYGILMVGIIAMIKYFILLMRRPKIQRCIEYVEHDWWQVGHITLRYHARFVKRNEYSSEEQTHGCNIDLKLLVL